MNLSGDGFEVNSKESRITEKTGQGWEGALGEGRGVIFVLIFLRRGVRLRWLEWVQPTLLHKCSRINKVMSSIAEMLRERLRPLVEEDGLEIVDLEFPQAGSASVLRIYVDRVGGVTVGQCASLSRKVSDFLDTEDLIPGRCTLEVSSPGLERPLAASSDFKRKIGEKVRVFFTEEMDGTTEVEGRIKDLQQENLILLESPRGRGENTKERIIPLEKVAKAKIIF